MNLDTFNLVIIMIIVAIIAIIIIKVNRESYKSSDSSFFGKNKIISGDFDYDKKRTPLYDPRNYLNDKTLSSKSYKHSEYGNDKYFIDSKFHNDYRDVITSFNSLGSDKKFIFNVMNAPVDTSIISSKDNKKEYDELKKMAKEFIKIVNKDIKDNVTTDVVSQGWDNVMTNNENDGWEEQQKALGLPTSIYSKSASKSEVILIHIDDIQKNVTEYEIQYVYNMIIKKKNTKDVMKVNVSLIQSKNNHNFDRDFFDDKKNGQYDNIIEIKQDDNSIIIEEIIVMGYFTDNKNFVNYDSSNQSNMSYYNYDNIANEEGITDSQYIVKKLVEKNKDKYNTMLSFAKSLDDDDYLKEFQKNNS